jgi:hypothetical protein
VILILFWTGLNGFLVVMDWMMRPAAERWILHFDHDEHLMVIEDEVEVDWTTDDWTTLEVSESEFEDHSGHVNSPETQNVTPEEEFNPGFEKEEEV